MTKGQIVSDVLGTLGDLDATVNLEMRPMRPLIDVNSTENHEVVQATLTKSPTLPTEPCVLLHVVTNNTKFTELPVRAEDWVRIYFDTEKDGEIVKDHKDLEVARTLNDTELLLAQGPQEPLTTPVMIEVWRRRTNKLAGLKERLKLWVATGQPNLDWEPTPDEEILHQVIERLNQTLAGQAAPKDWRPDPLLSTLPEELRDLPALKSLEAMRFSSDEGRLLQEAVWLRDVSFLAAGAETDELARATALFDWTVRHIQLESRDGLHGLWRRPWQSLLFGKGTADDRAWVFIMLARQQNLDAVMLAATEPGEPSKEPAQDSAEPAAAKLRPFVPAVFIRKQLYLFDPALGVPLPGPDGKGVATLSEVAENDALLRQLDLDETRRYPWKAADLATLVPWIVASPLELSARAADVERADKGTRRLSLSSDPSALAGRLKGLAHLAEPRLWPLPFETYLQQTKYDTAARQAAVTELGPYVWRPTLWKARLLDFKRYPTADLRPASRKSGDDESPALEIERGAKDLYMRTCEESELTAWVPPPVLNAAKFDAAYWLGQVALDRGNAPLAIDYFGKRTLERNPGGPWTQSARFNLARAYEDAGKFETAITWYEGRTVGPPSPQELGNHWRAKQLKAKMESTKDTK